MPGDKSISHRAVLLASLADGLSEIRGFLPGADCVATIAAMRSLGVQIELVQTDHLRVHGVGIDGLQAPGAPLDMGNSGTGMRLLAGVLAGQSFDSILTGDESLSSRPMMRIAAPLRAMGALVDTVDGHAPLTITGRQPLQPIRYLSPVASAQVKSAVLLAGLHADGEVIVVEPGVTRDHTERMLSWLGCEIDFSNQRVSMAGGQRLTARDIDVPGDFSAAAFFIVAAAISARGEIVLRNIGVNPTRIGLLDMLTMMGADIALSEPRELGGELVSDIRIRGSELQGIDVPPELVALAIDEFPVFFIAAACASGTTRVSGAKELRHKESDRIAAMADGLTTLGIAARPQEDGIVISGGNLGSGVVRSHGDHRIAMAFAVAATVANGPVRIDDVANVATSFPNFVECSRLVGMRVQRLEPR
ncbi:MAG: 3-phosphoshikimate 1-carboxyvinyltransferase [Gammaproteobacteria bacterium]|nr:3-phosphoshikimate 1-carboxyvinyltransferase [Gammaproteobacteria bacterium]